jgi:fermentation-respiration switch protein FrsA (DUF1100 family)
MTWSRWLLLGGSCALSVAATSLVVAASVLCSPANHPIGSPPPDLGAIDVSLSGVKGWFIGAEPATRCIVLMHGVRSDRRAMVDRARFLKDAGYAVLLFDFQAHGESPGEHVTFGYREALNAATAIAFLRSEVGCRRIGAIGQSMGGAAALLGASPLDVDALVLESVYPTIEQAVVDRIAVRVGPVIGSWLASALLAQLKPRLGIEPTDLRPLNRIRELRAPVLVASGTLDTRTPLSEAQSLFQAAPSDKEFWPVEGAGHVDLYRFAGKTYRDRILSFFTRTLPLLPSAESRR